MTGWTHSESAALYNVPNWGNGFFSIDGSGNVVATPNGDQNADSPRIDLHELIGQILARGVKAPLLLRFDGILRARVRQMNTAFNQAREEFGYSAPYRGVYPIKVNQDRHVVEAILKEGRRFGMGLEIGSKPELLAGISLQAGEGSLMICNGYKDEEYVDMALLSSQLGITAVLVIEKLTELDTILKAAERLSIRPVIGVRTKMSFKGSGRWQDSVGDRSKFGLTAREIIHVVETLRERDMLECFELLHFHVGSQITHVRSIKQAMREAANTLVGLHEIGVRIRWFDVGGGLGVDYDGSKTNFDSSMNYDLQEYANDVVWHLGEACREAEIPEPTIVTESGRALVAHHAVLVGEVVGVSSLRDTDRIAGPVPLEVDGEEPGTDEPEVVKQLAELCEELTLKNYLESYHDALHLREEAMLLFNTGNLSLPDKARVEQFYWKACAKILKLTRQLDYVPEDLEHLERDLSDTYFVNCSIFQSMPDSWAIGQLFPILPLHRHLEKPNSRGIIADMTCDSDGKIARFIDLRGVKKILELHPLRPNEPYFLGFFLLGAYQEILGDMHNLFGDTNIVHVDLDDRNRPRLTHVLRGDRVKEVLSYVEFDEDEVLRNLRRHVEAALEDGRMNYEESALFWRRFEEGLHGYTYLTRNSSAPPKSAQAPTRLEDSAELPS